MTDAVDARSKANIWRGVALGLAILASAYLFRGPLKRLLSPAPQRTTALRLVAAGQYEKAKPLLAECLSYDPSDAEARRAMAEVLLNGADATPEPQAREALALLEGNQYGSPGALAASLVLQGKAYDSLHLVGKAENAYSEALRTDPRVGEAGWLLLQIYYIEGRHDEGHRLAIRLFGIEPDPRDRVRLLLEPCRPDAQPLADAGVIPLLEPARRADPDDLYSSLAYFRALAGDGAAIDRALAGLRDLVAKHPDNLAAWDGLLGTLATTGQLDELAAALKKVPGPLAENPLIARHRGRLALEQGDFARAVTDLRAAVAARPYDFKTMHRLTTALKRAGKEKESEQSRVREEEFEQARLALRGVQSTKDAEGYLGAYQKVNERPNFGLIPDPPLYREFASIRERMGHPDEALAWHRLVLQAVPDDAASLAAVDRLSKVAAESSR